ncbi:hypothetical protein [Microbulbifer agarilyticus]|uniref:hypothetical protein n=1 Tax=Microbulbifer agarilyticus TaxID=260552 RepID=UPI001CD4059C|nr:hypothetical protein [Microbulbifer agarilyticus]MCA0893649.1 hypothetical protein [Microbulbifer agarilyticus]
MNERAGYPQSYPRYVTANVAGKQYAGGPWIQPTFRYCGKLPDTVAIAWTGFGEKFDAVEVPLAPMAPKEFMSDPDNTLIFFVTVDDQPQVSFRTKLSEVTWAKELSHPETMAEQRQRAADEALWQAVARRDSEAVAQALKAGGSVVQPWMSKTYNSRSRRQSDVHALLKHGIEHYDPAVMGMLLDAGLPNKPRYLRLALGVKINLPLFRQLYGQLGSRANPTQSRDLDETNATLVLYDSNLNPVYKGGFPVAKRSGRLLEVAVWHRDDRFLDLLLDLGVSTDFTVRNGSHFLDWAQEHATPHAQKRLTAIGKRTHIGPWDQGLTHPRSSYGFKNLK